MRYPRYKQGNLDDRIPLTDEFRAAIQEMRHRYDVEPPDEQARRLVVVDERPLPFDKMSDYVPESEE